ncbi:flagellar basal-body rod protein FlgF [Duganella sp. BJB488]|uniref:flagellar basal-body rod protein FlgF n=1 Tax=unclassified Duganella TaxID=2636909 RepID=UPI000E34C30E|nr:MULTISPECIES: flagellar basal-body rod protein FlgF [unclassified Duganella]NVD69765.1 flagellar basal-body rod protein FlgF [Duganella sp. BJB1802]RFP08762.1 flagellar basal-body rod protein FlgF [Duganella sp. BJB489]RFP18178.1 flagellar basal-body rod protein FlgF [Duganella sp. BJB488]RFP37939.1 flagellar basal-body rod protein FlgF [Duganella sp. BJB480]
MDALIYTAMSGAERALRGQQVHANNLANIETGGFRANMELSSAQTVNGYGYDDRHMSQLQANAVSTRQGTLKATGRELDVAISGDGFLAVQGPTGEAYTRAGAMTLDETGTLKINGNVVLGEGGPITLPQYSKIAVGADGTVSIQSPGTTTMQTIDKLKLVKAEASELTKNEAGLLVARSGQPLATDATVVVKPGHLEGSNVSAVEEMVATMSLNRTFEIQMKLFKASDSMAETGNRLIGG